MSRAEPASSPPETPGERAGVRVALVLVLGLAILAGWWWARASSRSSFPSGTLLTPLAVREDGRPIEWSAASGRATLVLAFSASCERCEELAGAWRGLLERIAAENGPQVDVVLLTADDPRAARRFLERHGLAGRLLQAGELPEPWAAHLGRVPQTIVVDTTGRVRRALIGRWDPSEVDGWWRELVRASEGAPAAHGKR